MPNHQKDRSLHKKNFIVAIDTNVINSRQQIEEMNELEKWDNEGLVEIVIPGSLSGEIKNYRPEAWNKIGKYRKVFGPGFYDNQILYGTMIFGSPEPEYSELRSIIFPKKTTLGQNDQRDIIHLIACIRNNVDYFVTDEEAIFENRDKIRAKFNINITNSKNIIMELKTELQK